MRNRRVSIRKGTERILMTSSSGSPSSLTPLRSGVGAVACAVRSLASGPAQSTVRLGSARSHLFARGASRGGVGLWFAALLMVAAPVRAQQPITGDIAGTRPPGSLSVVRSPDGRLQVTAAEATRPVRVDGTLDEEVWQRAEAVGGFVQAEPQEGESATEPTVVWVARDSDNLYIAAYCYDSDPAALVVNDIKKDFRNNDQDTFEVIIDTFADRRNGFVFMTNPEGARGDRQMIGEGRETNASWDAVWFVGTRRVTDGWTLEMAIPFKSLRFEPGGSRIWGINFSRRIRRKNEVDYWAPVPRAFQLSRVSLAGNLVGLPAASPGLSLRVKPYVLGSAVRGVGVGAYDGKADGGFDLKYGVTSALTLDITVRPDFAQVEADEQQVNLTQFSQFFPEKRDFFLENSGVFYVGDSARNRRGVTINPSRDTDLLLFFSRRIGLSADGRPIPIHGGARLSGQARGFGLGALTLQTRRTGSTPASNYTVLRARKNILSTSDVGGFFMMRQSTERADDYNRVYGADASVRVLGNLDLSTYVVKTETPGMTNGQYAARGFFNWEGNFFHAKGGLLAIGDHFNNELGFNRRIGVRKWSIDTGVRPRYRSLQRLGIREMHPHVTWHYYTDNHGQMVAKNFHNGYTFFFNNGGLSQITFNQRFERLTLPFRLHRGSPPIPVGGYGWHEYEYTLSSDRSRRVAGNVGVKMGGLWSGTQRSIRAGVALQPSHRFQFRVEMSRTAARLKQPLVNFVTSLWTVRTNYSFTTNMFLDSLLQYDLDQRLVNTNVRFNFIHRPLSDFFIVYNEERFMTDAARMPGRAVIVKFTRMDVF